MTRIYLAGPIQGREENQGYREELAQYLTKKHGFNVYDPWKDEAIFYKDIDYEKACYLTAKDKAKVRECDILIAYLPTCSVGAVREIEWALGADKRVIIICPMKSPSPHLISVTKEFYPSIQDFMRFGV